MNKPNFTKKPFTLSKDFKVRISQIPPMDVAFKTMAISEYELLVATIYKLNELIGMTNSYTELIDEILKWVVGDGLEQTVKDILVEWMNDGTLEVIINDALFNQKLDKDVFNDFVNNTYESFVDTTNQEIQNIQSIFNGEISRIDGELEDLDTNKADKTYVDDELEDLETNKADKTYVDGELERIDDYIELKGEMFISVKEFGAKGDGVTDDTQAFINALEIGKHIYVPSGVYIVKDTIVLKNGTSLIGTQPNIRNTYVTPSVIKYDGDIDNMKSIIQLGESGVGQDFTIDATNIYLKDLVIDGNKKSGFGVYGTFLTNETTVENVTSQYNLEYGFFFARAWYAKFNRLLAYRNQNIGISFGAPIYLSDGTKVDNATESYELNACFISEIRSHRNGTIWSEDNPETFQNNLIPLGSGIIIGKGNMFYMDKFLSETNGGVNLYLEIGGQETYSLTKGYLENTMFNSGRENTTRYGIYFKFLNNMSANLSPIFIRDMYVSLYSGGGVKVEDNGNTRPISWNNVYSPAFMECPETQLEKMYYKQVGYQMSGNRNHASRLMTPIATFRFSGRITETNVVTLQSFPCIIYIKKLGSTNPTSLTFTLQNGTTTSRAISSLPVNETVELGVINNVQSVGVTSPVSDSDGLIVEIRKPEPVF